MLPGRAYWVYVDADYTITINTDNFTVQMQQGIVPASVGNEQTVRSADSAQSSETHSEYHSQPLQNYGIALLMMALALGLSSMAYLGRKKRNKSL